MDKKSTEKVRQIIEAYAEYTYSAETQQDFAEWFADPRHSEEKDIALAELWSSISLGKAADLDSALLRVKIRLGHPLPLKKRLPRWIPRVAAVLLPVVILVTTFFVTRRVDRDPLVYVSLQTADTMLYEILPDSSAVWLNRHSSLVYTEAADGSRRAELRGEACFRVTHNGSVFEVGVPDLTVKVLGTEFNVMEEPGMTEVMLYNGSVEVVMEKSTVPLSPGTMLTCRDGSFSVGPIPVNHINWRYEILNFQGCDVTAILERVSRYWGLTLEMPAGGLSADPLTIRFDGNETIGHTMFLLQQLSGKFDYELDGDTMIITSK